MRPDSRNVLAAEAEADLCCASFSGTTPRTIEVERHRLLERKVAFTGDALWDAVVPYSATLHRVVLEGGMLSRLLHRELCSRRLNVICIDVHQAWPVHPADAEQDRCHRCRYVSRDPAQRLSGRC